MKVSNGTTGEDAEDQRNDTYGPRRRRNRPDSGNPRAQAFCPTCGSPVYSTTLGDGPKESYVVRVGVLRERDQLAPKAQNWTRSARLWLADIGTLPRNEKGSQA